MIADDHTIAVKEIEEHQELPIDVPMKRRRFVSLRLGVDAASQLSSTRHRAAQYNSRHTDVPLYIAV